ncbi:Nucleotide-binding universal stress protein, UspA family [Fictibacillus solisalsi]|uniref:Nucleotide-binding universal stress protein, UspA family n=1 Tax=Fictibacillus solisalsi TaxID=459525 RepID=A0A1G9U2A2_9BACL|nr:universal stress protein [Fictibacillus solisalsi]SDM54160.1 Nucleotide-binding universal stress protein, UspA family [Fictibacillus solisalsi]
MKTVYKHILVGLDGSKASEKAFKHAVEVTLEHKGAELILAHVVDTRNFSANDWYVSMAEQAQEHGEEMLSVFEKQAKELGVSYVKKVLQLGSPKVTLAKSIAPEVHADLIVCGATGMNVIDRAFIGSVSEHTTRYAKCDVHIVRND